MAQALTEPELIQQCLSDNAQEANRSFDELIRRHQKKVYALAFRFLGNHHEANDICQKTFVRVFKKLDSFQGRSALGTWIYRITVNLCKNYQRDAKRRREFSKEWAGFDRETPAEEISRKPAPFGEKNKSGPMLESIEQRQKRERLRLMIEQLPEKQRMVMILRTYDEMQFKEIADVLQCSVNTAKANYHYALENLKSIQKRMEDATL